MLEITQNTRAWVPVRLFNAVGSPLSGVLFSDVSAAIVKGDTVVTTYAIGAADWVEIVAGVSVGQGIYQLQLKLTDTDVLGALGYVVKSAASNAYAGISQVVTSPSLSGVAISAAVWDVAMASHVVPGTTGHQLTLSSPSPYVSFLANGDTVLPVIYSVASPKHTQVRVTFSEAVVMTSGANGALNLANYSIPGLTISAISALTAQQVLLTTSSQSPGALYNLTVLNVEDLQGNPIA